MQSTSRYPSHLTDAEPVVIEPLLPKPKPGGRPIEYARRDIAQRFGRRIRKMRLQKGLSQEALAANADLDRAFLSGIERGVENPSLFTIQAIADALDTTIGNLTKGL